MKLGVPARTGALALLLGAAPSWAQRPDGGEAKESPSEKAGAESEAGKEQQTDETEAGDEPATEQPAQPEPAREGITAETRSSLVQAYRAALTKRALGGGTPLSRKYLADQLAIIEEKLADGRRDEAIGDLVYLVESPRFNPFEKMEPGRTAVFLLGDALGRAGAVEPARGYLLRVIDGSPSDVVYRRAVRSLVEIGLESDHPDVFLEDLQKVPPSAPEELRGEIAYFAGRTHYKAGRNAEALAEFAKVTPRSRFWAQATYLSGLIEVDKGQLKRGEQLFCKVADAKQTPKQALAFGGSDFFHVRDMSRLALGRVAHEQYRFDDSRYYYYLVPGDSERLTEALYESATSRYEAKDYSAARDLVDELRVLERSHPYEDEVWIFDAYVDLALCHFAEADLKLREFLKRYDPVRNAARRLAKDRPALASFVETVRSGADPASSDVGLQARVARALGVLLRLDTAYGQTARRLAQLDHELSGLRRAMGELDDAKQRLSSSKDVAPRAETELAGSAADQLRAIDEQLGELRRLIRDIQSSGKSPSGLPALQKELAALEQRAVTLRAAATPAAGAEAAGEDIVSLVAADRKRATKLYAEGQRNREALTKAQQKLAADALGRLDLRLSRLLRRARLGRIETVLGRKRALEVEIEALSLGLLPRGAVDSLEAARYLQDDEEYWPFDGEDWEDEYVGGEGLR